MFFSYHHKMLQKIETFLKQMKKTRKSQKGNTKHEEESNEKFRP